MMTGKIFVYGSLMEGFFNYKKIFDSKVLKIEMAYVKGSLYHLKNKGYPGFIEEGEDYVYGEIISYKSDEDMVKILDLLEGYSGVFDDENPYNRCKKQVFNMEETIFEVLDVYVYNPKASCNLKDNRFYLNEGSWRCYMENN